MGTGTHHHDTAFSIVKALGIVAVVISHAAILTPLETFTYYFNTAVFFFVAGYFFDDGQTAAPGRFIGRQAPTPLPALRRPGHALRAAAQPISRVAPDRL